MLGDAMMSSIESDGENRPGCSQFCALDEALYEPYGCATLLPYVPDKGLVL